MIFPYQSVSRSVEKELENCPGESYLSPEQTTESSPQLPLQEPGAAAPASQEASPARCLETHKVARPQVQQRRQVGTHLESTPGRPTPWAKSKSL